VAIEAATLGGRPVERLVADPAGPTVLYLHGGGYVIGSLKSHRHLAGLLAKEARGTVITLDYRLAPEAPFPAALDDARAAWGALAATTAPGRCAIAGDSAGGGLAFATAIAARDAGMPLPGAIVGISPWVNLGTENPSYDRLGAVDPLLSREVVAYFAPRYVPDGDLRDPRVSPLFADLRGLPPTLIQIGDREVFFGDAADMHEHLIAAGVDATLAVWKEMFHVWHLYWPMLSDGRDAIAEIGAYVAARCGRG
jgi:acetyl esterase/lipase